MKPSEIKCGGGLMLLIDGSFSFFIELHLEGNVFNFESTANWEREDDALDAMTKCLMAFPVVVAKAASNQDFQVIEEFCVEQNIVKMEEDPDIILEGDEEEEEGPDDESSLH